MGNKQPVNGTGKKVTAQKLENAKKLGVLSLTGHDLDKIPAELYTDDFAKLRTLDLSDNHLASLGRLSVLGELKSLNLDKNQLGAGSLSEVSKLGKLQSLSCANNTLGQVPAATATAAAAAATKKGHSESARPSLKVDKQDVSLNLSLPALPVSLRQLSLSSNLLVAFPNQILSPTLEKLEKLDLSDNGISIIPDTISVLVALQELRLDRNGISYLPASMGKLLKLKVLSLKDNKMTVTSTIFTEKNPQPIPAALFTDTPLIDLNLHGNAMTNTQLNEFDGFAQFLERRQKVKSKTMTSHDVCGLE